MSRSQAFKRRLVLPENFLSIAGGMLIALILGMAIPVLPWWFMIGLVLLPIIIVASASAPQLGLLFVLLLIFEVVPDMFQPRVPFGGGLLKLYDMMIIYLTAVVLLRAFVKNIPIRQAMGQYWWPLIFVCSCLAVSLVYAHFFLHTKSVLGEARNFIGWLLIPLIILGVDSPSRYRVFFRGVLLIAFIVAAYVSIQTLFGVRIMTAARVEVLDVSNNSDVIRSIAGGGTYLMVFALFYFINRIVDRKLPFIFGMIPILILGLGLAASFGRGVWIATGIGLLVSAFLHRGVRGALMTGVLVSLMLGMMLGGVATIKPRVAQAVVERAEGIGTEVKAGGSFSWRKVENKEAIKNIISHPLFGVGVGGEYKKGRSLFGSFSIENTYIHNAYLYFPLKMGLFAVLAPVLLIRAFASEFRKCTCEVKFRDRGFLAAICGAFTVPVITSFTQPEWVVMQGIAAFAVLMSFTLLYLRYGSPSRLY